MTDAQLDGAVSLVRVAPRLISESLASLPQPQALAMVALQPVHGRAEQLIQGHSRPLGEQHPECHVDRADGLGGDAAPTDVVGALEHRLPQCADAVQRQLA